MTPTPSASKRVPLLSAIGSPFRGAIWENCQRFQLVGKAYSSMPPEQNGHFIIETARHLAGPLRALRDPNVRKVFIIGATQVMKSVAGDIWIPYLLEHWLNSILVLFETDGKAAEYCNARFMDTIKQHPMLSRMLGEVDRHDVTKTKIKFGGATLLVGGLNDSNVSSLSWQYIWVSEAWQHKSDGLLKKAIKRADRFPDTCKILIESQAGRAEEDLAREAKNAHQVPLTWACPECSGRQAWDFSLARPDGFQALPTRKVSIATIGGESVVVEQPPQAGTYSGMKFDSAENLTIDQRARTARWECYHCGSQIQDRPAIRQGIMDTYEQDYQIDGPGGTRISPKEVCFYLPKESACGNKFEDSCKNYLIAKEAEAQGNRVPLEDWYMSDRATFYSPKLHQQTAQVLISSRDIQDTIPDEVCRIMMVDCQQDPDLTAQQGKSVIGHFWYVAWAVDKNCKNIVQVARGYARSWQEWITKRKALKIPNKNVCIDGGNWLHEVLDAAAANWEEGINYTSRGKPFKAATVWTVMRGNGTRRSFRHEDGVYRVFSTGSLYDRTVQINGKPMLLKIPVVEWSNLSVKDQLFAIRQNSPGRPTLHILPREKLDTVTQDKEKDSCTYERQVNNEERKLVRGKNVWVELNPNVHYNDDDCMGIVKLAQGGLLGHIEAQEEEVAAAV